MSNLITLTAPQLRKAADLTEKIASLEKELASILGGVTPTAKSLTSKPIKKKRKMSASVRAKMAAAQKARWAKIKSVKKA